MTASKFVAVVTGGNKGIGKAIVSELARQYRGNTPLSIYLTARSDDLGRQAVAETQGQLHGSNIQVQFLQLDISSPESINTAAKKIHETAGHVDVLINNAAIAFKGDAFDDNVARQTVDTNYTGTKNVTLAFLPLVPKNGRIINVSSSAGKPRILSEDLQAKFARDDVRLEDLDDLMEQFIKDVSEGTYSKKGWPKQAYGVSKVGVTAFTRALARLPDVKDRNVLVAACCPGWVRTDMAGPNAPKSPEEGAQTPVWLALADVDDILHHGEVQNGGFYKDRQKAEW
ncbi:uncharacterized protein SPPG_05924 [Spizellomyces punctatus DAOM BR117]|uniref:Carbonyl reductase [NADPH] 1 n=1 Tax=Spizellomyces punctatus (strain DAOM BR117) TaxID=645134 RepID=A0A0L0HDX1_SPIPD|nr:uncharacterized protein SPPG_05924 [Spizellomyces punctatus DAOM BR117]KNC98968.1 hypothetical protein SPPG_05924 [Spizellomyces punctatus DAOM BR117]|eukprot:XP_016607008.1 hypothetical protein SPPG_05924 [Spizellomyces punctatus DAOM BR117]